MSKVAIQVTNVSKSFRLPHEKNTSLKSALINFRRRGYEDQHVLKNLNFEIKKGEFFGIVGRNGSGKSTLLKLLAGIYDPDEGAVTVNGKLTPFIELGVGFNPELSGRENVFLNGALLGFNRKEMTDMYDEIVAFAELERFMDQKLKNYSSGMQVRLAFSIAIRAKSDVLVLDEVLAVGDEAFQQKCIDVFEAYKANQQTVVLVTHDMATVKKYCTNAIILSEGDIIARGDPNKVANIYTQLNSEVNEAQLISEQAHKKQTNVISTIDGRPTFSYGDDVRLEVDWSTCKDTVKNVGIAVYKNSGEYIFGANTILDDVLVDSKQLTYTVKADLGVGGYHFKIGLFGDTDKDIIEFVDDGPKFKVVSKSEISWEGITYLEHDWSMKDV